jgi:hypothetical protein
MFCKTGFWANIFATGIKPNFKMKKAAPNVKNNYAVCGDRPQKNRG